MSRSSARFVLSIVMVALVAAPVAAQNRAERIREAENHYEAGKDLMGREAFEEAEQAFGKALDSDPNFYLAHYGLGQAYLAQKRYPAAIEAYNQCVQTADELNTAMQRKQLETDRQREDDLREAQDALRRLESEAQKANADQTGVQTRIFSLEQRVETLQQAKMRGQDQRMEIPAGLYVGLGSAYLRTGQLAEAEEAYEEAVSADDSLGEAHNNLAFVYFRTGRYDLAKKEIKAAEKAGVRVHPQFKKDVDKAAEQ